MPEDRAKKREYIVNRKAATMALMEAITGRGITAYQEQSTGIRTLDDIKTLADNFLASGSTTYEELEKAASMGAFEFKKRFEFSKGAYLINRALKAQEFSPLSKSELEELQSIGDAAFQLGRKGAKASDAARQAMDGFGRKIPSQRSYRTEKDAEPLHDDLETKDDFDGVIPAPYLDLVEDMVVLPAPYIDVFDGKEQDAEDQKPGVGAKKDGPISPEKRKFIEDASRPGDEVEEVMLKDPSLWTEEEARRVQGRVAALPSGHPERGGMDQAVRTFYDRRYGTDEVDRDAVGRLIEPEARVSIPDKPSPLQTPDGEDLDAAARRIGEKIIKGADDDDSPPPVKELQSGLNLINAETGPRRSLLKTDGTFGPKTRAQFRRALATNGPGKIEEAVALGKFRTLIEETRKSADTSALEAQTAKAFGRLFRGDDNSTGNRVEATILQEALNEATDGRVEKLKIDGDIGPKTRTVFELASKIKDPDDLSKRLGQMLGFLA